MPFAHVNGTDLYYEIHGQGAETIVFSHGLLWSGELFREQVRYFKNRYTCITYDHRGQGKSPDSKTPFDMETLYQDAVSLLLHLKCTPCHFVGLSMGGFIAMRIAARRPDLLKSCILLETSADEEPHKIKYTILNTIVKIFGVKSVTSKVAPIMFGQSFLKDPQKAGLRAEWIGKLEANRKSITRSVDAVIYRRPVFDELKRIQLPVLILVGEEDVATTPEKAERIKSQIPHAKLYRIPAAGHSSTIENPEEVNRRMDEFLRSLSKT
ncbi:MAG: alpha/beta hydrolase [Cytophagales bacterium]|nr:alpha/beta hydrolase [Bernardetiaceae bacterium]MDW8210102.1 alpha/beta hydrolase [Cytophagales bacterium]